MKIIQVIKIIVLNSRYVADISRQRAESMLKNEDKEGCFVVRNSSTPGLYTLSLYTKLPHPQVSIIILQTNVFTFKKLIYILKHKKCKVFIIK